MLVLASSTSSLPRPLSTALSINMPKPYACSSAILGGIDSAGEVRIGAGGKGRDFLVADMNPFNRLLAADRVGYSIERIAD